VWECWAGNTSLAVHLWPKAQRTPIESLELAVLSRHLGFYHLSLCTAVTKVGSGIHCVASGTKVSSVLSRLSQQNLFWVEHLNVSCFTLDKDRNLLEHIVR